MIQNSGGFFCFIRLFFFPLRDKIFLIFLKEQPFCDDLYKSKTSKIYFLKLHSSGKLTDT